MSKVSRVSKKSNKDNVSASSSNNSGISSSNTSSNNNSENRNYWYCGVIFALISVTVCAIYPILYSKPQVIVITIDFIHIIIIIILLVFKANKSITYSNRKG